MPSYKIFEKIPKIAKYKNLLLFILNAVSLFLVFLFIKFIHRSLIDPSIDLKVSAYLRDFDVYLSFANTITYPAQWICRSLGYDAIISGRVIFIKGSPGIIIQAPCMGFNIFSAFIALIVAYPAKVKLRIKVLFILFGILMIHFLNILRVTALVINNELTNINHHDLYNIIIYAFVLFAFYVWIKYYAKERVR